MEQSTIKQENLEKYNDYDNYKRNQESDIFNKKHGLFLGTIILVSMVIFLPLLSLIITFTLSVFISIIPAIFITIIGIFFYFFERSLKKKTSLLIKESPDSIVLSSPLYIDFVSLFSGFFFLTGIIFILLNTALSFAFHLSGMLIVLSTYYNYQLFKKLKYSLFDKIMIFKDRIVIDNPYSKNAIEISSAELDKIVDLRIVKTTLIDPSGALYKRIIEFQRLKNGTIEVDDEFIADLRLNMDLLIESLKKMDYSVKIETFVAGQESRFDEQGKRI